jgi:hypothetical protein
MTATLERWTLYRNVIGSDGRPTFGILVGPQAAFTCSVLERPSNGPHPCIPKGVYRIYRDSHNQRYDCPELDTSQLMPKRSQIQIHIGNFVNESEGCMLVGRIGAHTAETIGVFESTNTFRKLMERMTFPCELEIREP